MAAACADGGEERLVGLVVDQHVLRDRRAHHVPVHRTALQQHRVLLDVEDRAAVRGPLHALQHALDAVGEDGARAQVLEAQRMDAAARHVLAPGEHVAIRAHLVIADAHVVLALGEGRHVEDHLRRGRLVLRRRRPALAQVRRVLGALVEALPVPVAAVVGGDGGIVLLDARAHLLHERLLQGAQPRHHGVGVGHFGPQVVHDVVALVARVIVADPVVLVGAVAEGALDHVRLLLRHGRRGDAVGGAHGRCRRGALGPGTTARERGRKHQECRSGADAGEGVDAHPRKIAGRPGRDGPLGVLLVGRVSARRHRGQALKLEPQPQVVEAFGLLKTNPRPMISSLKSMVVPLRYR